MIVFCVPKDFHLEFSLSILLSLLISTYFSSGSETVSGESVSMS